MRGKGLVGTRVELAGDLVDEVGKDRHCSKGRAASDVGPTQNVPRRDNFCRSRGLVVGSFCISSTIRPPLTRASAITRALAIQIFIHPFFLFRLLMQLRKSHTQRPLHLCALVWNWYLNSS